MALGAVAEAPGLTRDGQVLLVALAAVELGHTPLLWSRAYRRFGDLSYGIYLYAYPVGSYATARFFDGSNFGTVALGSAAAVLALAAASWWGVERPATRLSIEAGADRC